MDLSAWFKKYPDWTEHKEEGREDKVSGFGKFQDLG